MILLAVAAGLAVANVFYLHPLLPAIGAEFGIASGTAALVVTAGTLGYTAGLALLVPLGDVVDRRRLLVTLLLIVAAGQAVSAGSTSIGLLVTSTAVLALSAVVAPLLVAFAAALAEPARRGAVTGTVLTGVLLGVLLARTGGGLIAEWAGGWRAVCAVAAVVAAVLAAVLHRRLPAAPPALRMRYPELLGSVLQIVRTEPVLRFRCTLGFLSFAGFTALWTSISFHLGGAPYFFGDAMIGVVGLLGAIGAWCARFAGPWVDRGREGVTTAVLLAVILAGWLVAGANGGRWLPLLLLGVLALDLGIQALQVTNLAVSLGLRPGAHSRITTAYMTAYFSGGIAGSAASAAAYQYGGWTAVCWVGTGFAVIAVMVLAVGHRAVRPAGVLAS